MCVDALLLEPLDLGELRLRLLRLVLLVAEPLDEAVEARDVDGDPVGLLLGVEHPRGLLAAPVVPRALEDVSARRSSSSTEVVTASRNQRSCATRMTAASID